MAFKYKLMALFFKTMSKPITTPKKDIQKSFNGFITKPKTLLVPTRHGKISTLIYKPKTTKNYSGVYYNIHGGGYIMRYAEQDNIICNYIAETLNCVVVSPEYDTAPQHRFPIPPNQCYDVYQWITTNKKILDVDPNATICIGGQSAGGAMSIGICMRAFNDKIEQPQLLIVNYPPLNLSIPYTQKPSPLKKPLISEAFQDMINHMYVTSKKDFTNPLISPAFYDDLSSLPKTLIISAEYDVLKMEAKNFAERLKANHIAHTYKEISEVDHFYTHAGSPDKLKECLDTMVTHLKEAYTLKPVEV